MAEDKAFVDVDVVGGLGDGSSLANAYASLSICEAAEQKDFDAANDTGLWECHATLDSADTTAVVVNGSTMSATDYLLIAAAVGEEAVVGGRSTTRYRLSVANATALTVSDTHVRIDGLQVDVSANDGHNQSGIYYVSMPTGIGRISNCRVTQVGGGSWIEPGIRINDPDLTMSIFNCIIENTGTLSSAFNGGLLIENSSQCNVWNCIVRPNGGSSRGVIIDAGSAELKNNSIFNANDDIDDAVGVTIDFNASDDGDGTNSVAPLSSDWDNEYVDSANGDFTPVSGGNTADGGINDPGSGLYSTGMDGVSYITDSWSIGVVQFPAGTAFDLTATDGGEGTDINAHEVDFLLSQIDGGEGTDLNAHSIDFSLSQVDGGEGSDINTQLIDFILSQVDGGVGTDSENNTVDFIITVEDGGRVADIATAIAEYLLSNTDGGIVTDSMSYQEAQVTDSMFMSFTLKQSTVNITIKQAGKNIALKKSGADVTKIT